MSRDGRVDGLSRISFTCSDLGRTERFYGETLDFRTVSRGPVEDPAWFDLLGGTGSGADRLVMRLGAQEVEFLAFDQPGRPYPADSTSTDLWFQHIAIVVADMAEAYARLQSLPVVSISRQGPQRLPPSTDSVDAFKFRDPDGHPLELLWLPDGVGDSRWQSDAGGRLFLGIDHSALSVSNAVTSEAFYTRRLGLERVSATFNHGSEQERLDDVEGDRVDVLALAPRSATPHVELLGYRVGSRRPFPPGTRANDRVSTRLVFAADPEDPLLWQPRAGERRAILRDGTSVLCGCDPDGHCFVIRGRAEPSRSP